MVDQGVDKNDRVTLSHAEELYRWAMQPTLTGIIAGGGNDCGNGAGGAVQVELRWQLGADAVAAEANAQEGAEATV